MWFNEQQLGHGVGRLAPLVHGHILQAPLRPIRPAYDKFGDAIGRAQIQVAAWVFGREIAAAGMEFSLQGEAVGASTAKTLPNYLN